MEGADESTELWRYSQATRTLTSTECFEALGPPSGFFQFGKSINYIKLELETISAHTKSELQMIVYMLV